MTYTITFGEIFQTPRRQRGYQTDVKLLRTESVRDPKLHFERAATGTGLERATTAVHS